MLFELWEATIKVAKTDLCFQCLSSHQDALLCSIGRLKDDSPSASSASSSQPSERMKATSSGVMSTRTTSFLPLVCATGKPTAAASAWDCDCGETEPLEATPLPCKHSNTACCCPVDFHLPEGSTECLLA